MADKFKYETDQVSSPSRSIKPCVPSDSNDLSNGPCKALFIGGAGSVTLRAVDDDDDITFKSLNAGDLLPVRAKAVRVTGTTATDILLFY